MKGEAHTHAQGKMRKYTYTEEIKDKNPSSKSDKETWDAGGYNEGGDHAQHSRAHTHLLLLQLVTVPDHAKQTATKLTVLLRDHGLHMMSPHGIQDVVVACTAQHHHHTITGDRKTRNQNIGCQGKGGGHVTRRKSALIIVSKEEVEAGYKFGKSHFARC